MRLIPSLLLIVTLLQADGRQWKLHPALETAVEQVKVGETTAIRGTEPTIGAGDLQARQEMLKAQRANDREGMEELIEAGKIAVLPEGTKVRVLERDEADLDRLMSGVHKLMDIDEASWKNCMQLNTRRAAAGLRLQQCVDLTFDAMYNKRFSQLIDGSTPESYIDDHVLVLVRVLTGAASGKKFWVPYRNLMRPSRPDSSMGPTTR